MFLLVQWGLLAQAWAAAERRPLTGIIWAYISLEQKLEEKKHFLAGNLYFAVHSDGFCIIQVLKKICFTSSR